MSKMYSMISYDTFQRRLTKMDKTQEVYHFELCYHNMTILDCTFKHFTKIHLFELVALFYQTTLPDHIDFTQKYLTIYNHTAVYIFPRCPGYDFAPEHENLKLIRIDDLYAHRYLSHLQKHSHAEDASSHPESKSKHSHLGGSRMKKEFTRLLRKFDGWKKLVRTKLKGTFLAAADFEKDWFRYAFTSRIPFFTGE